MGVGDWGGLGEITPVEHTSLGEHGILGEHAGPTSPTKACALDCLGECTDSDSVGLENARAVVARPGSMGDADLGGMGCGMGAIGVSATGELEGLAACTGTDCTIGLINCERVESWRGNTEIGAGVGAAVTGAARELESLGDCTGAGFGINGEVDEWQGKVEVEHGTGATGVGRSNELNCLSDCTDLGSGGAPEARPGCIVDASCVPGASTLGEVERASGCTGTGSDGSISICNDGVVSGVEEALCLVCGTRLASTSGKLAELAEGCTDLDNGGVLDAWERNKGDARCFGGVVVGAMASGLECLGDRNTTGSRGDTSSDNNRGGEGAVGYARGTWCDTSVAGRVVTGRVTIWLGRATIGIAIGSGLAAMETAMPARVAASLSLVAESSEPGRGLHASVAGRVPVELAAFSGEHSQLAGCPTVTPLPELPSLRTLLQTFPG